VKNVPAGCDMGGVVWSRESRKQMMHLRVLFKKKKEKKKEEDGDDGNCVQRFTRTKSTWISRIKLSVVITEYIRRRI
jgi:hypothetical protein